MKKPAKSAKKAAPAKKPAAKSAKAPAKAVKKPAPKTAKAPAKKAPAKKAPAKVVAKKAPAKAAAKKTPAKVVAKKAPAKVVAKKAPAKIAKPAPLSPKEKAKLQKQKAAEKLAAQKLKEKLAKEKAKEKIKAKELAKKQKEEEKRLKQKQKEDAKAEKLRLKEEEKRKKIEAKKGNKKDGLSPEEMEEESSRPRSGEDDDEDDFGADSARPKKMVFDEVPDEEFIPVRKSKKSVLDEEVRESLVEEILALSEDFAIEDVFSSIRNMELFKVESDECVVRGCDNPATTSGYCRYHYIKLWKDVKKKELILSEGKLAKIIEELVRKYPMKFIENIIQDLADDKAFSHVLKDLDIETDENEMDGFDDDELLDDDQDIAFETKVTKPSFED